MTQGLLAIVSHPDDETLGCGGTLAKHSEAGKDVRVLCLTCNPPERREEFFNAVEVLGVEGDLFARDRVEQGVEFVRDIADYIDGYRPSTVITHLPDDYHREHRICYEVVKEAIEWAAHTTMYDDACLVDRLYLMEVNTLIPQPDILVDISASFDVKMMALEKHKTQLEKFQWQYYQRMATKKAELRGVQCNVRYAEAFLEVQIPRNGPFYVEKSTDLLL